MFVYSFIFISVLHFYILLYISMYISLLITIYNPVICLVFRTERIYTYEHQCYLSYGFVCQCEISILLDGK